VLTGIVPYMALNVADPMAVAVDSLKASWMTVHVLGNDYNAFALLIKIGAITGLSSVMLVLMYGQTRIFYTMSKDGLLPLSLSKVHARFKTPYINTIIISAVVALAAGVTPISLLGDLVSLGTLVAFMIVCVTVLYLRRAEPNMPRPFRTPWSPVVPVLGILTCGYLVFTIFFGSNEAGDIVLTESGSKVLEYTGPYVIVGALIYLFYGIRHSALGKASNMADLLNKEINHPGI
jgi:APA family basic amino acid/polyamine antiporter